MRLTIDATTALGKTGVGTYVRKLIDAMLGMDSGVEFTLLFMGNVSEYPQRWREKARVVEAMAAGCPVVTSTRGACLEIAGGAAILVDPDDEEVMMNAMVRVIRDGDLREELKHKGMEQAQEFTWERAAHQTVDVYGEVAARHAHQ
jgi:glycosyltransferase involved in cell wall biosynthesis